MTRRVNTRATGLGDGGQGDLFRIDVNGTHRISHINTHPDAPLATEHFRDIWDWHRTPEWGFFLPGRPRPDQARPVSCSWQAAAELGGNPNHYLCVTGHGIAIAIKYTARIRHTANASVSGQCRIFLFFFYLLKMHMVG